MVAILEVDSLRFVSEVEVSNVHGAEVLGG